MNAEEALAAIFEGMATNNAELYEEAFDTLAIALLFAGIGPALDALPDGKLFMRNRDGSYAICSVDSNSSKDGFEFVWYNAVGMRVRSRRFLMSC